MIHQHPDELRNNCCVSAIRILPASKHIEIPESYYFDTVGFCEVVGKQLISIFCNCIRRKWKPDPLLDLWQGRFITICRRACCVDKSFNVRLLACKENLYKSTNIHVSSRNRIFYRSRDRTKSSLMENKAYPAYCFHAIVIITNVSFNKAECRMNYKIFQVLLLARREVIEAGDFISGCQKRFNEV